MARVLLLFVDGIGLALAADDNPFATEPTPALRALLGGPLTVEQCRSTAGLLLRGLDATLGVDGLPQSATGQTALFTGVNAPAHLGRHVTAFPGPRLAAILAEHSVLARAGQAGRQVTFANPFTPRYLDEVAAGERRLSATTLAAKAAGAPLRDVADLLAGRAVAFDVERDHFAERAGAAVPGVSAEEAGRHLAALAAEYDLTLFETFVTDLAGHRRWGWTAAEALRRLDGLLSGFLPARAADVTLVLTSDHGNLEESGHTRHTTNPVPLLVVGPAAPCFASARAITDVAPAILAALGVGS